MKIVAGDSALVIFDLRGSKVSFVVEEEGGNVLNVRAVRGGP